MGEGVIACEMGGAVSGPITEDTPIDLTVGGTRSLMPYPFTTETTPPTPSDTPLMLMGYMHGWPDVRLQVGKFDIEIWYNIALVKRP